MFSTVFKDSEASKKAWLSRRRGAADSVGAPDAAVQKKIDETVASLHEYAKSSQGSLNERIVVTEMSTGKSLADYEQKLELTEAFTHVLAEGSGFSNADMLDSKGESHPDNHVRHFHTHPIDFTFSDGDWKIFSRSTIGEMRVVTPAAEYVITKTPKFNKLPWQKKTPKVLEDKYNEVQGEIEQGIFKKNVGSIEDQTREILQETTRILAERLGVKYTINPIGKPVAKADTGHAHVFKANPYHDAAGRFTTQEKMAHSKGKLEDALQKLATNTNLYGSIHSGPVKTAISDAAAAYMKYAKHVGQNNSSALPIDYYAKKHPINMEAVNKLKQHAAAAKAVQTSAKKKVFDAMQGPIFNKMVQESEMSPASQAALKKKVDLLHAHYVANGGDSDIFWNKASSLMLDAKSGSTDGWDSKSGKTPKSTATGSSSTPTLKPGFVAGTKLGLGATTWAEPTGGTGHALNQNHSLGVNYYKLREELGKDHPQTQAAYAEWQKSKDYLTGNGVKTKDEIGSLSSKSKQAYEESVALEKEKKAQLTKKVEDDKEALVHAVSTMHQFENHPAMKLSVSGKESLKKQIGEMTEKLLSEHSLPLEEIGTLLSKGQKLGEETIALMKKQAPDNLKDAAYASAMLKAHGGDSYKTAKAALDEAKKNTQAWGHGDSIIKSMMAKGAAQAIVERKKQAKWKQVLTGDHATILSHYDTSFKPVDLESAYSAPADYTAHVHAMAGKLTGSETSAIKSYTGAGYSDQNKSLAGGSKSSAAALAMSGLSKTTLGFDMKLRRNAPQKWFWQSFGISEDKMHHLTEEELKGFVGKTYVEKAMSSTSKDPHFSSAYSDTVSKSGGIIYRIRAHKDIHGLDVHTSKISGHNSEQEVVLAPNVVYVVRGIKKLPSGTGSKFKYEVNVDAIGHKD